MKIFKKLRRRNIKPGNAIIEVDSKAELDSILSPSLIYDDELCLIRGVCIDNLIEAVSLILEKNPDLMMEYLKSKGDYRLNE